MIGNIFSNHWKNAEIFFQSLEKFRGGARRSAEALPPLS
jgi:hypothetical protein